jgi:hypothetical protein
MQENSKIVERIQKLLALSQSSNEHEAALALAKAQALLAEHNLSVAQVQARSGAKPVYLKEVVNLNSHENWRRELLARIARQNFCRTVLLRHTSMAIIGELVNTQAVQAMYASVVPQLEKLASAWYQVYRYQGGDVPARTWKNNFFLGAVVTIGERLVEEQRAFEAASNACRSLVVVKDRDLREAVQGFYPHLRTSNFRYTPAPDGYARGVEAGQQVRFRDEVNRPGARRS